MASTSPSVTAIPSIPSLLLTSREEEVASGEQPAVSGPPVDQQDPDRFSDLHDGRGLDLDPVRSPDRDPGFRSGARADVVAEALPGLTPKGDTVSVEMKSQDLQARIVPLPGPGGSPDTNG